MRPLSGFWREVRPKWLSRKDADHQWVFASYFELPSDRGDGLCYRAFLFRNRDRTVFGIKEWIGAKLPRVDIERLATKVVLNRELRASLISDDLDLPKMWKRR